jgi:serine-type D-Ala-D-Ala carboxypeptidase/endopeptidase (penicillin-binding protein 4)
MNYKTESRRTVARPRVNPVAVLCVLALIPAGAFAAIWKWAEAKKAEATALAPVAASAPVPTLNTPLLSLRRAPSTLANSITIDHLRTALAPLSELVGDTSCLVVADGSTSIFDDGADTQVTPASNVKLLTGATAMEVLGPDFRYTTELRGVAAGGVVAGDLYFVGGGDPLLSTADYPATQRHPPSSVTPLEGLVANLVAAGVTQISGNIVGDESRYDLERSVPTWPQGIVGVEAGPLSALMVNDGVRDLGNLRRYDDVAVGAATILRNMLKAANIQVGGKATVGIAPPGLPVLASIQSEPFTSVLAEMLTTSDNNTAELVLKELGFHVGTGGSRASGITVVGGVLVTWGIDTTALVQVDGSGLDGANSLTCRILLAVIQHELNTPAFIDALPIAGQTGTLDDELVDSPLAGLLRAKTGSLTNVKALSGLTVAAGGTETVEFSLVLNAESANQESVYRPIWAALAQALALAQPTPSLDQLQPR